MDSTKLQSIIDRKNDHLERKALDEASDIIESIASKQSLITRTQEEIAELRTRLTTLEIKQLDSAAILGGEAS